MENEKKQYAAWRNYNSLLTQKFDENALTGGNALYCIKFPYIELFRNFSWKTLSLSLKRNYRFL
jgi:hypothetical protein